MLENRFQSIDCAFVERNLIQYHEQVLSAGSIKTIRSHVETCNSCAQSLTEYRQLEGMLYADSMQFQPVFSPEAQARVQRNVYRRVRWRLLLNRPFSFRVSHGFAAIFLCLFAFMAYQRNQLSNDYAQLSDLHTVLKTEYGDLVSDEQLLRADYVQLFNQYNELASVKQILVTNHSQLSDKYNVLEEEKQNVRTVKAKVGANYVRLFNQYNELASVNQILATDHSQLSDKYNVLEEKQQNVQIVEAEVVNAADNILNIASEGENTKIDQED